MLQIIMSLFIFLCAIILTKVKLQIVCNKDVVLSLVERANVQCKGEFKTRLLNLLLLNLIVIASELLSQFFFMIVISRLSISVVAGIMKTSRSGV